MLFVRGFAHHLIQRFEQLDLRAVFGPTTPVSPFSMISSVCFD